MIWFTDGENQPSGQSAAEAFQEICGPEGPAEALHRERVHIFTVALANSSDFTPAGADALEAITDGDGGSRRCGSAATSELGLLTLAEDTDRLLLLLSTIFQPASRHTSSGVFLTDETVGGFQIVLSRLALFVQHRARVRICERGTPWGADCDGTSASRRCYDSVFSWHVGRSISLQTSLFFYTPTDSPANSPRPSFQSGLFLSLSRLPLHVKNGQHRPFRRTFCYIVYTSAHPLTCHAQGRT